ncbi:MAG: ABC transporter substrate-binding protein [Actinobacteria bacterium]|nr:ABC transporter substrate-binding protein [Actinomycetota bacterium]
MHRAGQPETAQCIRPHFAQRRERQYPDRVQELKLNPVGTGPFKFVSFASGDKLVVTKNDTYWQAGADGKPMPYVDGITYRVITDAATQFAEMRANSSDFAQNVRGRDVPAARQITHATYVETPFGGNKRQYFFSATKEPFKDNLKLRQAVHHAVDREAISKAVGGGLGIALPYEFIPGATGYDASLPFYEFNLDKAKQLIKESGVALPLSVRLTAHNREQDVQQAEMLQQMLDKIGVKIVLDIIERVAWGEKVRIQNDFIMASRQSGVAVDPTDDLLVTWAESGNSAYHRGKVPGLLDTLQKAGERQLPPQQPGQGVPRDLGVVSGMGVVYQLRVGQTSTEIIDLAIIEMAVNWVRSRFVLPFAGRDPRPPHYRRP